ncbi:hypothetical protein QJS10_CPB20g01722 [Acorus calamus]|uniref:Uncharacterized protein n=1 Tax=Acorus calamus TaxID=4465 RepID=A0AAV9CCG7_ACOCL|nr:hypothetical protein QJS10_CPB20g01722 [Acorus calamus]
MATVAFTAGSAYLSLPSPKLHLRTPLPRPPPLAPPPAKHHILLCKATASATSPSPPTIPLDQRWMFEEVGDQRPRHLEHDVVPEGGGSREHGEDLVHCGRHRQDPRPSRLHHRHPHPRQEPPHLHPLRRHGRLRHRRECGEGCGFGEEEDAEAVQEALGEAGRDEDRDFRSAAAEDPGEDYRARLSEGCSRKEGWVELYSHTSRYTKGLTTHMKRNNPSPFP